MQGDPWALAGTDVRHQNRQQLQTLPEAIKQPKSLQNQELMAKIEAAQRRFQRSITPLTMARPTSAPIPNPNSSPATQSPIALQPSQPFPGPRALVQDLLHLSVISPADLLLQIVVTPHEQVNVLRSSSRSCFCRLLGKGRMMVHSV